MENQKQLWINALAEALSLAAKDAGVEEQPWKDRIVVERPPKAELGDLAFPMFPFARDFRKAPPQIAQIVQEKLNKDLPGTWTLAGPYVNVFLDRGAVSKDLLDSLLSKADKWGSVKDLDGQSVMIEFSSPNTNKPLHLGHLRNNALGESSARILDACGAKVRKVNLINDRGIHICKSMLAYDKFGEGDTPEGRGIKSDHLVGEYYVKYNNWSKEDPTAEEQAQEMLRKWEQEDPEVLDLWAKMNRWTMEGLEETYKNTNISFDQFYFESQVYKLGKEYVQKGLDDGAFYKAEDGSVRIDMEEIGLDSKVLLRSDGTSVYITQDIGTAISRHEDWPFQRLIYVVGAEQDYHFKVLFYVLSKLGFDWTKHLYHLSYGMVNLPDGKMKSREGTVVDADDLLAQLENMALEEIRSKGREDEVGDAQQTAHNVALGALHYYLLQVSPKKDMIFNPKESLSFNGNTGPYLQYTTSRISSMLRKANDQGIDIQAGFNAALLTEDQEWDLVKLLGQFPQTVSQAGEELNPSLVASYLYQLAKAFSRFYHDLPVLNHEDPQVVMARLALSKAVLKVMEEGFYLVNIPFMDKM